MQLKAFTHDDALVHRLVDGLVRSRQQLNGFQESDAELIRMPDSQTVLAVTTDQIVEEIQAGLYDDPYLIGWMAVLVSASDLAAVGAEPLGILLNLVLPKSIDVSELDALKHGVRDATEAASLPLLGGDTNFGDCLSAGTTGLGTVAGGDPLTRRGAQPGDVIFASGPLGLGSAFAFQKVTGGTPVPTYQPAPRIAEGRLLRPFASAAIDTSDGALAALDLLMHINGCGAVLLAHPKRVMHREARSLARSVGVPEWALLAGPHGEFELLFTVSPARRSSFLGAAAGAGFEPVELGRIVRGEPGSLRLPHYGTTLDTTEVRRAHALAGPDPDRFLDAVLATAGPLALV